jgi:hypothetical protein
LEQDLNALAQLLDVEWRTGPEREPVGDIGLLKPFRARHRDIGQLSFYDPISDRPIHDILIWQNRSRIDVAARNIRTRHNADPEVRRR